MVPENTTGPTVDCKVLLIWLEIKVLQVLKKMTEGKHKRKLLVGVGRPWEASWDISVPIPRRPRRDPTRPSNPEGVGAAKCQQEKTQEL